MKTIEEKAKAYDKAIERARKLKENPQGVFYEYSHKEGDTICDYIFPELKENKDDRIKKCVIDTLKNYHHLISTGGVTKEDMLAWLEKQGTPNQVSIWKHWKDGICGNGEGKPIYLTKYGRIYSLSSCLCFECDYIELSELDNLMLEKQEEKATHINGEDYGIDGLWHAMNILEKTLGKVDGYQTDDGFLSHQCAITAVKKLYKQKPTEWSEEDETELTNTIIMLKEGASLHFNKKNITKAVDWLKSLKQRIGG